MSVATHADGRGVTAEEASEIAVEAYVYLYPLLTMETTRRQMTNVSAGARPGLGPMDTFSHIREFPPADFRTVVRPNFDTLYSAAWLDLTEEPRVVSIPDTDGRYYVFPLYDMWTDVFAAPGKRTSGTSAHSYAVTGPGWRGTVPDGVETIQAPTSYVWIIARTQTNGPSEYDAVHVVQDGYMITPLSRWAISVEPATFEMDPRIDMQTPPLEQVNTMEGRDYFTRATELMRLHPPHATDWSTVERMSRLGIRPGKDLHFDQLLPDVQEALASAPQTAQRLMREKLPTLARAANGWQMNTDTMGVYGNYYLKRAIVSMAGLGANQPEDAIYPLNIADAAGSPLDGANDYRMHFSADDLPPVGAFWSVTMYDAEGFQVANEINRFAIGDRDDLRYNADGSLDLYLQHASPGADKESNWLPAPRGPLGVTMRLYAPRPEVLDGRWAPPAITPIVSHA